MLRNATYLCLYHWWVLLPIPLLDVTFAVLLLMVRSLIITRRRRLFGACCWDWKRLASHAWPICLNTTSAYCRVRFLCNKDRHQLFAWKLFPCLCRCWVQALIPPVLRNYWQHLGLVVSSHLVVMAPTALWPRAAALFPLLLSRRAQTTCFLASWRGQSLVWQPVSSP